MEIGWPSGSVNAGRKKSGMDKIEMICGKSEATIQVINLFGETLATVLQDISPPPGCFQHKEARRLWVTKSVPGEEMGVFPPQNTRIPATKRGICSLTWSHKLLGTSSGLMCGAMSTPITYGDLDVRLLMKITHEASHLATRVLFSNLHGP